MSKYFWTAELANEPYDNDVIVSDELEEVIAARPIRGTVFLVEENDSQQVRIANIDHEGNLVAFIDEIEALRRIPNAQWLEYRLLKQPIIDNSYARPVVAS